MNKRIQELQEKLSSDFFGFWVKRRRVTIMVMVLLIGGGLFSLGSIPKESSPNIEFGIIGINTVYVGASPEDVDQLVTEKIEKAINDIDGIDKIESTSRLSVSSINVTLENEADTNQVLADIKDEIEKLSLPTEVEDPSVTEISTDTEQMFDVLMYANANDVTISYLKQKAESVKSSLEGKYKIAKIDIDGSSDYEIRVLLDKTKVENIGIGLQDVAQIIRGFVTRLPLGNYIIDETSYDYRFTKSIESEEELENTIIPTNNGVIRLSDIATIERKYDDERILKMGSYQDTGYEYVRISFDKNKGANIFSSSASAKEGFEQLMKKNEFADLQYSYVQDIAEVIQEDYQSLAKNGLTTLILVFIAVFIFVGRKESLIATVSIPLAFFVTFIVLNQMGLSLNFLTNFSLIVTFGIAIDTIIVIIEGAAEKMKLGHDPFSSVLLAVRDYKRPLIAGTTTTVIVFIPLFALPGVTGKFLAYIPITIFITLIAALFISLTINPVLYYLSSKKRKYYIKDEEEEEYMDEDEKEILNLEREGKKEFDPSQSTLRHRTIDRLGEKYESFLKKFLKNKRSRLMVIILPVILLILSFPLLAPAIGFQFFPSGDNPYMFVDILAPVGSDESVLKPYQGLIDNTLSEIPEIENYYYTIDKNKINISIELFSKEERERAGQRDSFGVEDEILEELSTLRADGFTVESAVQSGGPPVGKAVGVKLIAETIDDFNTLKNISSDFEDFLKDQDGTKNISNTSEDTPGQFIFDFDKDALEVLRLTPGQLLTEIRASINGITAGSLPGKFDDYDIKVLYQEFVEALTPQDVENIVITTSAGAIRVGDVANYTFASNINAINREDGNIVIRVESDIEKGMTPTAPQAKLAEFAKNYQYPSGISFEMAGENNENSDIIVATGVAFVIALLMIYSILVLQFNSFKQPMFIMYTVLMALLGTNIGLYLTGNPYSMAFGIGFIALTGIVVNDAIVFIDRINRNRTRGMDKYTAITEAGKTRLQPIILTTITTILGLMSIVREDEFFAGLAYTIMFGLFVGSLMTLFVIPAIYYQLVKE